MREELHKCGVETGDDRVTDGFRAVGEMSPDLLSMNPQTKCNSELDKESVQADTLLRNSVCVLNRTHLGRSDETPDCGFGLMRTIAHKEVGHGGEETVHGLVERAKYALHQGGVFG